MMAFVLTVICICSTPRQEDVLLWMILPVPTGRLELLLVMYWKNK